MPHATITYAIHTQGNEHVLDDKDNLDALLEHFVFDTDETMLDKLCESKGGAECVSHAYRTLHGTDETPVSPYIFGEGLGMVTVHSEHLATISLTDAEAGALLGSIYDAEATIATTRARIARTGFPRTGGHTIPQEARHLFTDQETEAFEQAWHVRRTWNSTYGCDLFHLSDAGMVLNHAGLLADRTYHSAEFLVLTAGAGAYRY